jgi:peptide/nickel transport system ATP-binding protein
MGVLFVTHDLGVVAQIADRIVVMYAGKVMERGDVLDIFERPAHPYTRRLLECVPEAGGSRKGGIPGTLPDPHDPPAGCRFAPRCSHAVEACRTGGQPAEHAVNPGQHASCVHYRSDMDRSVLRDGSREERPAAGEVSPDDE